MANRKRDQMTNEEKNTTSPYREREFSTDERNYDRSMDIGDDGDRFSRLARPSRPRRDYRNDISDFSLGLGGRQRTDDLSRRFHSDMIHGRSFGYDVPEDVGEFGSPNYRANRYREENLPRHYTSYSVGLDRMPDYTGRGPKGYKRSNERIREDVSEALERHPEIDASEIEVEVEDGIVTLRGSVENRRQKRMAEDCIEFLSGVRDIRNDLSINRSLFDRAREFLTGETKTNVEKKKTGTAVQSSRR